MGFDLARPNLVADRKIQRLSNAGGGNKPYYLSNNKFKIKKNLITLLITTRHLGYGDKLERMECEYWEIGNKVDLAYSFWLHR